jgi:hypothetical protein
VDTGDRHFFSQRSPAVLDMMPLSDYRTKDLDYSDPLNLHRVALEVHGIAPWTETNAIPVPLEHQKEFAILWLTRKRGLTFWLGNITDLDLPLKSVHVQRNDADSCD